jgi:hypothetical protein
MSSPFRVCLILANLFAASALCGCGKSIKTGDVVGKITLRGKPPNVEGLAINFLGSDGRPVSAPIASDGTYRASGVSEGLNRIAFSVGTGGENLGAKLRSRKPKAEDSKEVDKDKMKAFEKEAKEEVAKSLPKDFPPTFLDPQKSNVSTTVASGQDNTFNVDIK